MAFFPRSQPALSLGISFVAPGGLTAPRGGPIAPQGITVSIPTDLMFAAYRQLFPAERMVVFGGRRRQGRVRVTSLVDVTEPHPSAAHVRACPQRLSEALIDLERTASHLAIWMHS